MKKKLFLVLPFASIIGVFLFFEPILTFAIDKSLGFYCLKHFGETLNFRSLHRDKGVWILEKPSLETDDATLKADKILLDIRIKPLQRKLEVNLVAKDFALDLSKGVSNAEELLTKILNGPSAFLLNLQTSLSIVDGKVLWCQEQNQTLSSHFQFQGSTKKESLEASVHLQMDEKDPTKGGLALELHKKSKKQPLQATLFLQDIACQELLGIFQSISYLDPGFEVLQGMLKGKLEIEKHKKRYSLLGGMELVDFSFKDRTRGMKGQVTKALANCQVSMKKGEKPSLVGNICIDQGSQFAIEKDELALFSVDGLEGQIDFFEDETVQLAFEGKSRAQSQELKLTLKGGASLFSDQKVKAQLSCFSTSSNNLEKSQEASVHVMLQQLDKSNYSASLQIEDFSKKEFLQIQSALSFVFPEVNDTSIQGGTLSAFGVAFIEDFQIKDVIIDKITGQDLQLVYHPLDVLYRIESIAGGMDFNWVGKNPLQSLNANFQLAGGEIDFASSKGARLKFKGIGTELRLKNGALQKSEMHGVFTGDSKDFEKCGLKGTLVVDWMAPKFLNMQLSGKANHLLHLFPNPLAEQLNVNFEKESVHIQADMHWQKRGASVLGTCHILTANQDKKNAITFGFDLEKTSKKLWQRWPADHLGVAFWDACGLEAFQSVMPPMTFPFGLFEVAAINAEAGIAGLVLKRGWFQTENLSLEKYVAPLIFPSKQMQLTGMGSFKGVFDYKSLSVEYNGNAVVLENPNFLLFANNLKGATYYIDFQKRTHFGKVPLSDVSYLEKSSGLKFEKAEGTALIFDEKIHIKDVFTSCCDVKMRGEILLSLPSPNCLDLGIKVSSVDANIVNVLDLFGHFVERPSFPRCLFDGNVRLKNEGALLAFQWIGERCTWNAKVDGSLEKGAVFLKDQRISCDNLQFDFSIDHAKKALEISHLNGEIFSARGEKKFEIISRVIRVSDYTKALSEFDLKVSDEKTDLISLVGKTTAASQSEKECEDPLRIKVELDRQHSHFGHICPKDFQMIVKDLCLIENFQMSFDVDLQKVRRDLVSFNQAKIFPFSNHLEKRLQAVHSLQGTASVTLAYPIQEKAITCQIKASDVSLNDYAVKEFSFCGKKSGNDWCIDSLRLDDLLISGNFEKNPCTLRFNQGFLEHKGVFKIGLDGDYFFEGSRAVAHISQFEMCFENVHQSAFLRAFFEGLPWRGKMRGTGELLLDFLKGECGYKAEAIMDTSFDSFCLNGLCLQNFSNVSCHFVSDKGVTLRNIATSIINEEGAARGNIRAEKAVFEFVNGEVFFDRLWFQVPAHHLPWFTSTMRQAFPTLLTNQTAEVLRNCKLQGNLEAVLQYEYTPPYTALQLRLSDGKYLFLNSEHEISQFVMEYDPFEFKVTSKYLLGGNHVMLHARSTSPYLAHGEMVLTDGSDRQDSQLFIFWENDPKKGFSVNNVEGQLYGLNFDMQRDNTLPLSSEAMYLIGKVTIDAKRAGALFPEDFLAKVTDWQVGKGYQLQGKWRLQKGGTEDYANNIEFAGKLKGSHVEVKGYQFDSLIGDLEYTPKAIKFRELVVNDASGILRIDKLDLIKAHTGHWYFSLPVLSVEKARPYILKEVGRERPRSRRPLVIRDLKLYSCQGKLSDSSSFVGKGRLLFSNRARKHRLQNTIFHIPSEILSRLGLDLAVLTPVTGAIEYKIQNGRVYFTRFKDIYSESKLSKFNLASYPSTVDFEGNLDVRVRMKQNNLLFKLAELLTVNIGGNLFNPSYSLQQKPVKK